MMYISELFELAEDSGTDVRITCLYRWLVMFEGYQYVVYKKLHYKKKTTIICRTSDQKLAVAHLLKYTDGNQ